MRSISSRLALVAVATLAMGGCVVQAHPPPRGGPGPGAPPPAAYEEPPEANTPPHQIPPGAVRGAPGGMHPGAPAAYWIWADPNGMWHLRTTTAGSPHRFRGRIAGATGAIVDVRPSRLDFGDRLRSGPRGVGFDFHTRGHIDGVDFRPADNGCVRFALFIDGGPHPKRIFVGAQGVEPPHAHFAACP